MAADQLSVALDRFDVPAMSPDLADRIIAATATMTGEGLPQRTPPRHDRSRLWKRGRQVLIGSVAAGMLSAAAVASGLLGAAGIQVPVLMAMLAPPPAPLLKVQPKRHRAAAPIRRTDAASATAPVPVVAPTMAIEPTIPDRERIVAARQMRRERFVANHPRVAAVIERRIVARIAERRAAAGRPLGPRALTPDGRPANPLLRARVERQIEIMLSRRAMMRRAALVQPSLGDGPVMSAPQAATQQGSLTRVDRVQRWQKWRQRRAGAAARAEQAEDLAHNQDAPSPTDPR